MDIKKFWVDTTRHRLPHFAETIKQKIQGTLNLDTEVAVDEDTTLSALADWAANNPLDTLQRGRDPERGIDYLRKMEENDAHYAAMMESRRMALLSHDLKIAPGSDDPMDIKAAEWMEWNYDNIDGTITEKIKAMQEAHAIGFSIQEQVYERITSGEWAGKWRLKDLKDKDQKSFRFMVDRFGNLLPDGVRMKQASRADLSLSPEKFLIYVFNKKRGSWYGNGIGVSCSWYSWFKRDGIKFWLVFLQKFGNPTVKAKVNPNAKTADKDQFKDIIESFSERTGIILPEGFEVELMEATRRGEAGFLALLDYCDRQISKRWLGATLTAEPGPVGSFALGKEHGGIRQEYAQFDGISICNTLNEQVNKRLIDYNFTNVKNYPTTYFEFRKPLDRKTLAEALKLAQETGIVIPTDWAYEEYRIPPPQEKETTLVPVPKTGGMFSEAEGLAKNSQFQQRQLKLTRKLLPREEMFSDIPGVSLQLNRLFDDSLVDGRKASAALIEDILAQIKKKLTVGGRLKRSLRENPIVVNVSGLRRSMVNSAMDAWLWGNLHAVRELERMGFTFKQARLDKFEEGFQEGDAVPPPMEAVKFFKNKVPITKAVYAKRITLEKDRYFTMAGVAKNDIERIIHPLLLQAIERGDTFEDVNFAVKEAMVKYTGEVYAGTPLARAAGEPIAEYHLNTVFRTNLMKAYNEGRMEIYNDPEVGDFVPWLQYSAVMDEVTTEFCEKYDGRIFKKDDPIWTNITPPNHFNCRSSLIPVPHFEEGVKLSRPLAIKPAKGFE